MFKIITNSKYKKVIQYDKLLTLTCIGIFLVILTSFIQDLTKLLSLLRTTNLRIVKRYI